MQVIDAVQEQPELPQPTTGSHKRSNTASSSDHTLPTSKRSKTCSHIDQDQLNSTTASATSSRTEAELNVCAKQGQTHSSACASRGGSIKHEAGSTDEEAEGDSSDEADESLGDDSEPEGPELGNVSIADSSEETLSNAMLHALKDAIQNRLQQYASPSIEPDQQALEKAQAAAGR